jgi:hypothetical protein
VAQQSRLHLRWLDQAGKPLSNFGALQEDRFYYECGDLCAWTDALWADGL